MKTESASSRHSHRKHGKLSVLSALALSLLALVAGAQIVSASFNEKIPTVQISAKRMSVNEKIAYDTAGLTIPTVVLTATRLSSEQKLAMDLASPAARPSLAQKIAKWRQHG